MFTVFDDNTDTLNTVRWSPKGNYLVATSSDGYARVVEFSSLKVIFKGHSAQCIYSWFII